MCYKRNYPIKEKMKSKAITGDPSESVIRPVTP